MRDTDAPGPGHLILDLPGCIVKVLWESGNPRQALRTLYPYHRRVSSRQADHTYQLRGRVQGGAWLWTIVEDDQLVAEHCAEHRLADTLERQITIRAMSRQGGQILIHAATARVGGGAVVLPAPSGAGKTTLTLALRDRGIQVLGDDILMLDPVSLTARAFPRSFLIKGGTAARRIRLEAYRDVHGEISAGRAVRVDHLIFLERRTAAIATLSPCTGTESLQALIPLMEPRHAGAERSFHALVRVIQNARRHRLIYAEASQGAVAAARLLGAWASSSRNGLGQESRRSGRLLA
ncbi:MAG: hypothetical protein ACE5HD_12400 [Acidobacteriota bacterium]